MRPGQTGEGGGEAGIDGRALWQVREDVVRLGLMGEGGGEAGTDARGVR